MKRALTRLLALLVLFDLITGLTALAVAYAPLVKFLHG